MFRNLVGTAGLTLSLEKGEHVVDTDVTLDVTENGAESTGVGVEELNANLNGDKNGAMVSLMLSDDLCNLYHNRMP
jgi:hypothetical protein